MKTAVGFSGGPILVKDAQGRHIVVGIHTHRGLVPGFNSGIFLSGELLLTLKAFERTLNAENALPKTAIFTPGAEEYVRILG
jgi:hypothetical protein